MISGVIMSHNIISVCSVTRREKSLDTSIGIAMGAAIALRADMRWMGVTIEQSILVNNAIWSGILSFFIYCVCCVLFPLVQKGFDMKMNLAKCVSDPGELHTDWWSASGVGGGIAIWRDKERFGFQVTCTDGWCVPVIIRHTVFQANDIILTGKEDTQPAVMSFKSSSLSPSLIVCYLISYYSACLTQVTATGAAIHSDYMTHTYIHHCIFDHNSIRVSDTSGFVTGEGGAVYLGMKYAASSYANHTQSADNTTVNHVRIHHTVFNGSSLSLQSSNSGSDGYGYDISIVALFATRVIISIDRCMLMSSVGTVAAVAHAYMSGSVAVRIADADSVINITNTVWNDEYVSSEAIAGAECLVSGYYERILQVRGDQYAHTSLINTTFNNTITVSSTREGCEATVSLDRNRGSFTDVFTNVHVVASSRRIKWIWSRIASSSIIISESLIESCPGGVSMEPYEKIQSSVAISVVDSIFRNIEESHRSRGGALAVTGVKHVNISGCLFEHNDALTGMENTQHTLRRKVITDI
jgi:hypothetical protein